MQIIHLMTFSENTFILTLNFLSLWQNLTDDSMLWNLIMLWSSPTVFFKIVLDILCSFAFQHASWNQLINFYRKQKSPGILIEVACIYKSIRYELVSQQFESLSQWLWYISPFITTSLVSHNNILYFSVYRSCLSFVVLIPKNEGSFLMQW